MSEWETPEEQLRQAMREELDATIRRLEKEERLRRAMAEVAKPIRPIVWVG